MNMSIHRCGDSNCPLEGLDNEFVRWYIIEKTFGDPEEAELQLVIKISQLPTEEPIPDGHITKHLCDARRYLQSQLATKAEEYPIEIFLKSEEFDKLALALYKANDEEL